MDYSPLDLASLAVFILGAIAFSTLTVFYWSGWRSRGKPGKSTVFPVFTLACAAAFLSNLLPQVLALRWAPAVVLVRELATGLIPPLVLHVVLEAEARGLAKPRAWRSVLLAVYAGSAVSTLLRYLDKTGLAPALWSEPLYRAPAITLAAASAVGLLSQVLSRRPLPAGERGHRNAIRAVLLLMLLCAAASLGGFGAFVGPAPDYLLLAFFGVSLYYRERLVFFDLLVKRGVFLAVGLVILAGAFALRQPRDWSPWSYAAGWLLLWLASPWIYTRVARTIDHVWLRRPYSPAEAERQFIRDIQAAVTVEDLRARAGASLGGIFQSPAAVRFDRVVAAGGSGDPEADSLAAGLGEAWPNGRPDGMGLPAAVRLDHAASDGGGGPEADSLAAELEGNGAGLGRIRLGARPNGVPFLSDDRRLLQSLAGALAVVLENVRFRVELRRQEEREQQLRWLASRAELKALRAQINPHFLFNALSVIAGLVHYRPELADEAIEQLAQVFRYTLRKSESEWARLSEEVDFVSAYLRIEQVRFGERLRVEFAVDPAAADVPIPAMSIQPLIENAIKHGVSAVEGRGTVGLRATLHGGLLAVEVSDSGPGFPAGFRLQGNGEGHGLRNVMERLRGYYGDAARLSWESGRDGTRVVLTLPPSPASGFTGEHARDTRTDRGR